MRVEVDGPEFVAALPGLLPFAATPVATCLEDAPTFSLLAPASGAGYRYLVSGELILEDFASAPVFAQFARDLMIHVANFAPHRIFLHAGVVTWQGRALVLPGASFAGKTTLTAALLRAGASYFSDEYAVIDSEGMVHPYARDLQVRRPGEEHQIGIAPAEFGCVAAANLPASVALVVFARYLPEAQWAPQPISRGMAVLEMLRHTIPVQRTPGRVMAALSRMVEYATAWTTDRGDADLAAGALLQMMSEPVGPQ